MKRAFKVFLLLCVGAVLSLDHQEYFQGFCNQLGFSTQQISENIDCFANAVTKIQDFKTAVTNDANSVSDTTIIDWLQKIKLNLMEDCSLFEKDLKNYFSTNTLNAVFQEALCDNLVAFSSEIKQQVVAWAAESQDQDAGKKQGYIYQVIFGVIDPTYPIASFTSSISGLTVSFDASGSTDSDGIADYAWDFGESGSGSNTASGSSTSGTHTYASPGTYIVTLKVTDNTGKTGTTTSSIRLNADPTAAFTYSISGTTITFNAASSSDSDGIISDYGWEFGDTNTASESTSSTSHTYNGPATYTVVLTVTDNDGATGTETKNIRINAAPTASFTATPSNLVVSFDASASTDDASITLYEWNFGDSSSSSNTASGASTTHTFTAAGTYTVTLKVTDSDGATNTKTDTVTVSLGPVIDFTSTPSFSGKWITFTASSTSTISTYAWNFGESGSSSNTASVQSPIHRYTDFGSYTVELTVTYSAGGTGSVQKTITVPNICSTQLHFFLTSTFENDGDLWVKTPGGKLIWANNEGPNTNTEQGKWLGDALVGSTPEEICWAPGQIPPLGIYNICFFINFTPTSPVQAQVTVVNGGVASVLTKTFTTQTSPTTCETTDPTYVGSIFYPDIP